MDRKFWLLLPNKIIPIPKKNILITNKSIRISIMCITLLDEFALADKPIKLMQ